MDKIEKSIGDLIKEAEDFRKEEEIAKQLVVKAASEAIEGKHINAVCMAYMCVPALQSICEAMLDIGNGNVDKDVIDQMRAHAEMGASLCEAFRFARAMDRTVN